MRRGSVLLEVLVAVAILVGAGGSAILAASDGELGRCGRAGTMRRRRTWAVVGAVVDRGGGLATPQESAGGGSERAAGAAWMSLDRTGFCRRRRRGRGGGGWRWSRSRRRGTVCG